MSQLPHRRPAAIVAASAIVLCAMATVGAVEIALALAPVALLVSALLAGCYPGEGVLAWMAERAGRRVVRSREAWDDSRPLAPYVSRVHGGLLIARSLCGRAPPLLGH